MIEPDAERRADESSGLSVSADMQIKITSESPWIAVITWTPTGKPPGLSVRLREIPGGNIQIDYGSRAKGGRRSTRTKNRQEAVWFADEKLRQIIERGVDNARPELEARLAELADARVPYTDAARVTGYPLGFLRNNPAIPNVGTSGKGEFRLGDLPFKGGMASPARRHSALRDVGDPIVMSAAEKRIRRMARRDE